MAVQAAERVKTYAPSSEAEFQSSPLIQDAVCMRLQEIGENLSKIRQHFPALYEEHHTESWHRLIGLRNVISHGYAESDMAVVWTIVDVYLDAVRDELNAILMTF